MKWLEEKEVMEELASLGTPAPRRQEPKLSPKIEGCAENAQKRTFMLCFPGCQGF
jgi:hypothetical protein